MWIAITVLAFVVGYLVGWHRACVKIKASLAACTAQIDSALAMSREATWQFHEVARLQNEFSVEQSDDHATLHSLGVYDAQPDDDGEFARQGHRPGERYRESHQGHPRRIRWTVCRKSLGRGVSGHGLGLPLGLTRSRISPQPGRGRCSAARSGRRSK
jgi:hypothetical protein